MIWSVYKPIFKPEFISFKQNEEKSVSARSTPTYWCCAIFFYAVRTPMHTNNSNNKNYDNDNKKINVFTTWHFEYHTRTHLKEISIFFTIGMPKHGSSFCFVLFWVCMCVCVTVRVQKNRHIKEKKMIRERKKCTSKQVVLQKKKRQSADIKSFREKIFFWVVSSPSVSSVWNRYS